MQSETHKTHPKRYLYRLLSDVAGKLYIEGKSAVMPAIEISIPEPQFGDFSTNLAMRLAKILGQNPKTIAENLCNRLKELDTEKYFEKIEPVGGFVNLTLAQTYLATNLQTILEQGDLYGCSILGQGKKVVFEYSSPNTNKPLHIGHTRNDTYGMACINLLKSQGYKVVSCEIINDRGIHIMKSVLMYMKFGENKTPDSEKIKPDHFVGQYYRMFAEQAAKSEAAEKEMMEEAQALLQKWEAGDKDVRGVWQKMNNWWYQGVKQTYEKEGSTFDEVDHESEIYDKGRDIVTQGVEKGIFIKEEDGSVSVDLTADGLDKKYLLRKDGTTIYITQDIYLWDSRNRRHNPDLAIVTTATEQSYHFKVLGKIFELLGYPWAQNFKHLPYEHVYLGKDKMSSRGGNTVSADELLESVKQRVKETMNKSERVKASVNDGKLVEAIAFGAIKFGYLKYEPNTRIYFDLDQTISIEGNTGPYIQYAHARIASILKNAESNNQEFSGIENLNDSENKLIRKLLHFGQCLEQAAKEYKPNLLCNYLYQLAADFNYFYQQSPVLKEPDKDIKNFRLQLIAATAQVIRNGLSLLGIEAPEEM